MRHKLQDEKGFAANERKVRSGRHAVFDDSASNEYSTNFSNIQPYYMETTMAIQSTFLKPKTLVLGLATLSMLYGIAAYALPSKSVYRTYYSNAQKTHVVGHYTLSCSGAHHSSGKVTNYSNSTSTPCHH